MKKLFFLLVCLCLALVACRETSVKVKHAEYPYALIQGHRLIAFQLDEDGEISGKEEVRLPTDVAGDIQMRDLIETSDAYYATTSSGKANQDIIKISKKDWTVTTKPIKYQGMGLVAKGDSIYVLSMMGGLYQYDQNLKQLADNQLIEANASFYDMALVGKDLYVLGQQGEYDENHNYKGKSLLWRLDNDLRAVETIVLDDTGAIMNMATIGSKIYMTMTSQGKLSNGEPAPADKILTYDTMTKEQELVHTGQDSPMEIAYNPKRDELYVRKDSHQNRVVLYYLYTPNLDFKDVLLYPLPEDADAEGFLLAKGDQYFYLDGDKLFIRDFKKENLSEIPLKDFKLDNTSNIVLLDKD